MMGPIRRRDWLAAGLASSTAITACSRPRRGITQPNVTILRAPAYDQSLYQTVKTLLSIHKPVVRGKRVVLKPNLVEFESGAHINTNPLFVHAVYEGFAALGAASVTIAEGPGHRRITFDLADAAGYFRMFPNLDSIFVDLNLDDISHVPLARPLSRLESVYLPNTILGADLLVSLPKMKTHHWVGTTLSMKNLFGIVPGAVYGWPKNVLHWAGIAECIADLHTLIPSHFAIVDGIEGMEGNGPIQGKPKHAGVIVGGPDFRAVDATCCRIMRIDPLKVPYLPLSAPDAHLADKAIRQTGETVDSVQTTFDLIPEFRHFRLPERRS